MAVATERGRQTVQGPHLLYALTQHEDGPLAELLETYGSSVAILKDRVRNLL